MPGDDLVFIADEDRVGETEALDARRAFLGLRVSGGALARDFLVSAPPSPAPGNPFLAWKAETGSNTNQPH
jgi:hypothetical protein